MADTSRARGVQMGRAVARLLAATAAVALSISSPTAAQEAAEADTADRHDSHYRIFVGDHAEGIVRAFDLADGAEAGTFRIEQTPSLTRSDSGRTVFAVQGEAGKVAVIGTGVSLDDHGDHPDLTVEEAQLLPIAIAGEKPAHVIDNSGTIALFDDGDGSVRLFSETAILDGTAEPRELSAGKPHHGLAVPMGDFLIVSVAEAEPDGLRRGLKVIGTDGQAVGPLVECPGVHGQASSGRTFAFGCRDGIVLASPGTAGDPPTLEHHPIADLGEGYVSTLKGGTAMRFFLGNYGPDAIVIIEPGAEEEFRKIDLPTRRVDFALDPAEPRNAFVLTEDGELHRIDILSGKIAGSARVTEPYSMDGHWRDPRPRLAVAGDQVAITDPRESLVRLVSTESLAEERTIEVEGVPYTIVAVGGSGAVH